MNAANSTIENCPKVVARAYIKTGGKKAVETVEATVPDKCKEDVLWSLDKLVPHTICAGSKTELWQSSAVTNQGLFAATDPEPAQPTLTEQDTILEQSK
ncbi:hypothetical protein Aduo_000016 [Ancylostoma duodenale]